MYYESCPHCLVEAIKEFPVITLAKANDVYKNVVKDIEGGVIDPIHQELFDLYKNNYHKAIRSVFGQPEYDSKYFDTAMKFELNTARFAAYKSHYATQTLIKSFEADPDNFGMNSNKILKQFARWQATEYNTAISRCRTAKQFIQFQDEAHLYPNLEWLITRSADPREEHLSFVGLVLPIDDPFWQENQPGNLYNCKCDWKTTDAPVTGSPAKLVKPHPGLDGNPARTGQIFTDKHPYFGKAKNVDAVEEQVVSFALTDLRTKMLEWSKTNLLNTVVENVPDVGNVVFTVKGLKEALNQPHDFIIDKNLAIFNIAERIKSGKFLKFVKDKKGKTIGAFYIETMINNKKSIIVLRKSFNNSISFYCIVDKLKK